VPRGRAPPGPQMSALSYAPTFLPQAPSTPQAKVDRDAHMYIDGHATTPTMRAMGLTTPKEKTRLAIVSDASPGTSTATPGSIGTRMSAVRSERDPLIVDSDNNSPRWMADPAYVCETTADYRSVSPGGHSTESGESLHHRIARDGTSPVRCWPRTPSSCASPGTRSPTSRWPQTPSSTAAASPNTSPSPRRKARGGLTPAALNLRLRDIFGEESADATDVPGPEGTTPVWSPFTGLGDGDAPMPLYVGHQDFKESLHLLQESTNESVRAHVSF